MLRLEGMNFSSSKGEVDTVGMLDEKQEGGLVLGCPSQRQGFDSCVTDVLAMCKAVAAIHGKSNLLSSLLKTSNNKFSLCLTSRPEATPPCEVDPPLKAARFTLVVTTTEPCSWKGLIHFNLQRLFFWLPIGCMGRWTKKARAI